jgi:hypothetical protein
MARGDIAGADAAHRFDRNCICIAGAGAGADYRGVASPVLRVSGRAASDRHLRRIDRSTREIVNPARAPSAIETPEALSFVSEEI